MAKLINIPIQPHNEELTTILEPNLLPKPIKRVFWIYNNSTDSIRGKHRHKKSKHLLICIAGSCKVYVNDGNCDKVFLLNNPKQLLYLEPTDWREMYDFSENCVLSCFCDELYDPNDYIYIPYKTGNNKLSSKLRLREDFFYKKTNHSNAKSQRFYKTNNSC